MDGGEVKMKRIIFFICVTAMLLSLAVTANAQKDEMYYEQFDNYEEFEQDYYDTVVFPEAEDSHAKTGFSPFPPIIGIVAGATVVFVLYRKHTLSARRAPEPHPERIKAVHTVTNTNTL